MSSRASTAVARSGVLVEVEGRVQGVGFRPFVNRLAVAHGLSGWVRNRAGLVEIAARGEPTALRQFLRELVARAPPLARPRITTVRPSAEVNETGFTIRPSEAGDSSGAELAPDHFVCDECLAEMADPNAPRYRYPFINCTQCGPRYSIIRELPYDRAGTTMNGFAMCPRCREQYSDPADRRYHAQPLACSECGPRLQYRSRTHDIHGNEAALAACVDALGRGLIVAVKGIGGYHLVCDAANEQVVQRLRAAKHRPHKPLAVMIPMPAEDPLHWAYQLAILSTMEETALRDPVRPIVLARRRAEAVLAPSIAPGLIEVGLMLPYSPLHHLLLQAFARPVVATSANLSGEPVLTEASEVELRLGNCCDAYLHHDRPIYRPADDPVLRVIAGRPVPLRLGRGTAPAVLTLPCPLDQPALACGGQMRATVALGWRDRVVVSPHVGDQGSPRSARVFQSVAEGLQQLYCVRAEHIACDAHPGFSASAWARHQQRPIELVQHHYAHASALMGEHGLSTPSLIFAWDGVGFGEDGRLWGGETLYGAPGRWVRIGTFRSLALAGGDAVAHEPWRSAAAVCWALGIAWGAHRPEYQLVRHAWERRINTHESSAVGRLFDAAAALIGVIELGSYDGQAPAMLEALTQGRTDAVRLPITHRTETAPWTVDWEPLFRALIACGENSAAAADLFHASLAGSILDQARAARERCSFRYVGFTGGVFQNRRLTEQATDLLIRDGFEVLLHERVPPNDGGLSFGQLVELAARRHGCEATSTEVSNA